MWIAGAVKLSLPLFRVCHLHDDVHVSGCSTGDSHRSNAFCRNQPLVNVCVFACSSLRWFERQALQGDMELNLANTPATEYVGKLDDRNNSSDEAHAECV